jgi:predicted DNA-binding transcriptional regulator AlpA
MDTAPDRLVPPREGMRIIGVRSPTTYYRMVANGDLPPLIRRGRNVYHLASDLSAYLQRLVATRDGKAA